MSNSIHGHQVMELMISIGRAVSKEELTELMSEHFGKQAKYHTCSASDMDAQALIDFLDKKGKFIQSEDGIQTATDRICKH